jgi:hypothetical protein
MSAIYQVEIIRSVRVPVGASVNGKTLKTPQVLASGVYDVSNAPVQEWVASGLAQINSVDGALHSFGACCSAK